MRCPHPDCGKKFDQLVTRVDLSGIFRETCYACPHCKNRIDLAMLENRDLKFPGHSRNVKREKRSSCPHYFGYLKLFSSRTEFLEECLTCKRLTECTKKDGYV